MKNRIKQIIEFENISYSKFADLLGIQRSGISHIINGRNKPSLEVVQKVLETFEYIDTDWLLFGKGSMKKDEFIEKQGNLFDENIEKEPKKEKLTEETEEIKLISEEKIEDSTEIEKILHPKEDKLEFKKIERVLIFYSDKTFKDYLPENE